MGRELSKAEYKELEEAAKLLSKSLVNIYGEAKAYVASEDSVHLVIQLMMTNETDLRPLSEKSIDQILEMYSVSPIKDFIVSYNLDNYMDGETLLFLDEYFVPLLEITVEVPFDIGGLNLLAARLETANVNYGLSNDLGLVRAILPYSVAFNENGKYAGYFVKNPKKIKL
jgi:hypothetical protein